MSNTLSLLKSPWRNALYQLVWPAILQGLVVTVVFLTDRILVGRYHIDGLSVMQICGPILWSVFSVFSAIDVATIAIVGRAVGAKDEKLAHQVLIVCLASALFIALLTMGFGWILHHEFIPWMGRKTPHLQSLAQDYFMTFIYAAPFKMLGGTASCALQAGGDTKTPMWISLWVGVCNLLLSAMFIYGWMGIPSYGIIGAAYGSVLAFILQAILALLALYKRRQIPHLRRRFNRKIPWSEIRSLYHITVGVIIERLGYHLAFLMFSVLITGLGSLAMGTHQVLLAVESVGFICADAFGIAASALVAQRLGAQDQASAREVSLLSALLGGASLSVLSIIFLLFPSYLIGCITHDKEVIALAVPCLQFAAVAQPLMAMSSALSASLRSAGDTKNPVIATIIGPIGVRLIASWYFAYYMQWGIFGIWVASTLDWLIRVAFLAWIVLNKPWHTLNVSSESNT